MLISRANKKGIIIVASQMEYEKLSNGIIKFCRSNKQTMAVTAKKGSVVPEFVFQQTFGLLRVQVEPKKDVLISGSEEYLCFFAGIISILCTPIAISPFTLDPKRKWKFLAPNSVPLTINF